MCGQVRVVSFLTVYDIDLSAISLVFHAAFTSVVHTALHIADTSIKIYEAIAEDGKSYKSCSEENKEFKEWVAAGNTPG